MSLRRSNPHIITGIASGEVQERPRNDMMLIAKSRRIEEVDLGDEPALIKFLNADGLRKQARVGALHQFAVGAAVNARAPHFAGIHFEACVADDADVVDVAFVKIHFRDLRKALLIESCDVAFECGKNIASHDRRGNVCITFAIGFNLKLDGFRDEVAHFFV